MESRKSKDVDTDDDNKNGKKNDNLQILVHLVAIVHNLMLCYRVSKIMWRLASLDNRKSRIKVKSMANIRNTQ
jgi:hypothetical protein